MAPGGQLTTHMPATQAVPGPHAVPHAPQFKLSLCTLVQTPLQLVTPGWHDTAHFPLEQTCPIGQAVPHMPVDVQEPERLGARFSVRFGQRRLQGGAALVAAEKLKTELEKIKDNLGPDSQRRIDTNPLRVLDSKLESEQPYIERLPRIADHLSEVEP